MIISYPNAVYPPPPEINGLASIESEFHAYL
jgi:hypothetical protein